MAAGHPSTLIQIDPAMVLPWPEAWPLSISVAMAPNARGPGLHMLLLPRWAWTLCQQSTAADLRGKLLEVLAFCARHGEGVVEILNTVPGALPAALAVVGFDPRTQAPNPAENR